MLGNDMILYNPFNAELEYIRRFKQQLIDKNNQIQIKIANRTIIDYVRTY